MAVLDLLAVVMMMSMMPTCLMVAMHPHVREGCH
jgi:hypothetical protein